MPVLQNNQKIGAYEVKRLIKENNYCETYRVEDDKEEPFFLKLFILKNTPEKMLNDEHRVKSIELISKLRHKNLISYIGQGTYQDDSVGDCQYVVTNYFSGELLADKLEREKVSAQAVADEARLWELKALDLAALEKELYDAARMLGIGPMGSRGINAVLAVNVDIAVTHTAALPVAFNAQCLVGRRWRALVAADGTIQYTGEIE